MGLRLGDRPCIVVDGRGERFVDDLRFGSEYTEVGVEVDISLRVLGVEYRILCGYRPSL